MERRTLIKAGIAGTIAALATRPTYAAPTPYNAPLILVTGNSISACQPAARPYFEIAATDSRISAFAPAVVNASVAGWGVDNLAYTAPFKVYPILDGWQGQKIVVLWEGTNHIVTTRSARASWDAHAAYADELRRHGAQVIIGTIMRRVELWAGFDHNATRLEWNEMARQEWRLHADALMDMGADALLNNDAPAPDARYWLDGAHPNTAGHEHIAPYLVDALLPLLQTVRPASAQVVKPAGCLALPFVTR